MSNNSGLRVAVSELSQTTGQVNDAVVYCNEVLENFVAGNKVEGVPEAAKECVQGAISAIIEHVNAASQQVLETVAKQESETNEILQIVENCAGRIKDLKKEHY
jgi:hypothetical protein|tara:strand:- start:200 stop:511 length:312 start_codon:yes stop_codon:yes gene_type:complete